MPGRPFQRWLLPPHLSYPLPWLMPWTLPLHSSKISSTSTPLSALISHLSRSLILNPPFQEFFDPDSSMETLLNTQLMSSLPFLADLDSMLSHYSQSFHRLSTSWSCLSPPPHSPGKTPALQSSAHSAPAPGQLTGWGDATPC